MIQERFAQGVYVKDIAAELGVHPRTISRALRCSGAPSGRRPAARKSKLDPYQPMIDQLLDQGVWNAQVILREIQAAGYPGKRSILSAYIAPKRPLRRARATVRFETARRGDRGGNRPPHAEARASADAARALNASEHKCSPRFTQARISRTISSGF